MHRFEEQAKLGLIDKLIAGATNPRDRALVSTLANTEVGISEAVQLKVSDIDFKRSSLTIVHLKERLKVTCPYCSGSLGKRHIFCPGCGNKVDQVVREKVEQRQQRMISIDRGTLQLLAEYLKWRRRFPYRGPLVFPISRQRGWQLVNRIGRRSGMRGLNPRNLRHWLARPGPSGDSTSGGSADDGAPWHLNYNGRRGFSSRKAQGRA